MNLGFFLKAFKTSEMKTFFYTSGLITQVKKNKLIPPCEACYIRLQNYKPL